MNPITYSYEVIAVDEAARVMEVVYTSEGRPPVHMGARLPYQGETLDMVIEMYAPIAFWRERDFVIAPVQIGVTGQKTADAPPPPPTPEEMLAMFTAAIDGHVENVARSRQYNGAAHLASYVASTVPQWSAEAQVFVAWRDAVWLFALVELEAIQAGTKPIPTTEDLIASLPAIEWPVVP